MSYIYRPLPEFSLLISLLRFDDTSGKLFWKPRTAEHFKATDKRTSVQIARSWNSKQEGKEAGTDRPDGYRGVAIYDSRYMAHRIAYKMVTEKEPDGFIDHINGDRKDNRFENLRVVESSGNQRNLSRGSNNKSGVTGVYWCKTYKKWKACIQVDRRNMHVGQSDSFQEAVAMRQAANEKFGFHENHGQR